VDPDSLQAALPPRSAARQQIETAKDGVLAHIRRRWMQIRDSGGFLGLENWSLKEISDGESWRIAESPARLSNPNRG
jgi:hypothetical protein